LSTEASVTWKGEHACRSIDKGNTEGSSNVPLSTTFVKAENTTSFPEGGALATLQNGATKNSTSGNYVVNIAIGTGITKVAAPTFVVKSLSTKLFKSTEALPNKLNSAGRVGGILRSTTVYEDSPYLSAAFQVRDGITYNTNCATDPTISLELRVGGLNALTKEFVCAAKENGPPGLCIVEWDVKIDLFEKLSATQDVYVLYKLDGGSGNYRSLGKFTAIPTVISISDDVVDTISTVLPFHPVYAGQMFELQVRSRFLYYLKSLSFQISVGSNLEIVKGVGGAQFKSKKFDGPTSGNNIFGVLVGRVDSKPHAKQTSVTDELLATITVKVVTPAADGDTADIGFTKLVDVADLTEAPVKVQQTGVVWDRNEVHVSNVGKAIRYGSVNLDFDSVVATYPHIDGPAELMNTAVLSGTNVSREIKVYGVRRSGQIDEVTQSTCLSENDDIAKCGTSDAGFTALLDGTELKGSAEVDITITTTSDGETFSAVLPVRVSYPLIDSSRVTMSKYVLRPIAGWFDTDAASKCTALRHEEATPYVTVSFAEGEVVRYENFDVSALITLKPADTTVGAIKAKQDGRKVVTGVGAGETVLQAVGATGQVYGEVPFTVPTDKNIENVAVVVGLDIAFIGAVGDLTLDAAGPYSPNHKVSLEIAAMNSPKLFSTGDKMHIVVSAILDDDDGTDYYSRYELFTANGLTIESSDNSFIAIDGNKATLLQDVLEESVVEIRALWEPSGSFRVGGKTDCADCCEDGRQNQSPDAQVFSQWADRTVNAKLSLPTVESMTVVATSTPVFTKEGLPGVWGRVVPADDEPGGKAGFGSSVQLSVSVQVDNNRTLAGVENDPRTTYEIISGEALVSVNEETGIITALSPDVTGTAIVKVVFAAQSDRGVSVNIEVTKTSSLNIIARAEPAYNHEGADSTTLVVKKLQSLGCTDLYEKAQLEFELELENKETSALLRSALTDVAMVPTGKAEVNSKGVVSVVGTLQSSIAVDFTATFAGIASAAFTIKLSTEVVEVTKLINFRLEGDGAINGDNLTTFNGEQEVATAQARVGAVFANGRVYESLFSHAWSVVLPGVVKFASTRNSVDVLEQAGTTVLASNDYQVAELTATSCNDKTALIMVAPNLDMAKVGDVDLGVETNLALGSVGAGQFTVPVRINTGGNTIAYFKIVFKIDKPSDLKLISAVDTVKLNDGSVTLGLGTNADKTEVTIAGTISDSKVKGFKYPLLLLTFEAIAGVDSIVTLSGEVIQLLNSEKVEVSTPAMFEAGYTWVHIDTMRRQRDRRAVEGVRARALRPRRAPKTGGNYKRVQPITVSHTSGDTNCDGKFDGEDALFLLQWIAARGSNFVTALGKEVKTGEAVCKSGNLDWTTDELDIDQNGEVSLADLSYLLDVDVGKFYFMDVTYVVRNVSQALRHNDPMPVYVECSIEVEVTLVIPDGVAPNENTRVFVDVEHGTGNPYFRDALDALDNKTYTNRGKNIESIYTIVEEQYDESEVTGALMRAYPSDNDPTKFTFFVDLAADLDTPDLSVVGLSLIVSTPALSGDKYDWRFFGGKIADGSSIPQYPYSFEYSADALESSTALLYRNGFNPRYLMRKESGGCHMSTGSSTATSSATSTATSSATSSGTTSASSTATSSATSSVTTTVTSSITTTASTSASNSGTTTFTTTATSSASTSATSSATTSATSTATTSATSSATTSASTTPTTTATSFDYREWAAWKSSQNVDAGHTSYWLLIFGLPCVLLLVVFVIYRSQNPQKLKVPKKKPMRNQNGAEKLLAQVQAVPPPMDDDSIGRELGIAADVALAPVSASLLVHTPVPVSVAVSDALPELPQAKMQMVTDVDAAEEESLPAEGFTDYIGALENMYGGMEVGDDDGVAVDESYLGIVDNGGNQIDESQEAWEAEFQRKRETNRRRLEAEAEAEALQLYGGDAKQSGDVDGNSLKGEALVPDERSSPSKFQAMHNATIVEQAAGVDDEAVDFNNSDFADWLGNQPAHFHPAGP
jgi:hypothetical protein